LVEKYPGNLIVRDSWGATPLLYAVWGDAPSEIIEFLVNSYQSLYSNNEFDWIDMLMTLGQANASVSVIQNLLNVQNTLSPNTPLCGSRLLMCWLKKQVCMRERRFLTRCSIATGVNAIGGYPQ
jgi:hypothetical protein